MVDSKMLEHGCRVIYAGFPSFFGLGLEDGHVPTFWLLLYGLYDDRVLMYLFGSWRPGPQMLSRGCDTQDR